MNPQERDVINGIFDRLKQAEGQPRDAEVEAMINERLAAQPGAAYFLAQIVHVQEQALANLNDRVNALQAEVEQAKAAPASGGFLSSLFGVSTPPPQQGQQQAPRPAQPSRPMPQQQGNAGPWNQGGPQQGGPWGNRGGAGGGFLASAMTTAAGVAGGLMLGNVLTNAFGLNSGSQSSTTDQASAGNEAANQDTAVQDTADAGNADATYQDASYDQNFDGGFDDFSGGDDWI